MPSFSLIEQSDKFVICIIMRSWDCLASAAMERFLCSHQSGRNNKLRIETHKTEPMHQDAVIAAASLNADLNGQFTIFGCAGSTDLWIANEYEADDRWQDHKPFGPPNMR